MPPERPPGARAPGTQPHDELGDQLPRFVLVELDPAAAGAPVLTVRVTRRGFTLVEAGGTRAEIPGRTRSGSSSDAHDHDALARAAAQVKRRHPNERRVIVSAGPRVAWHVVVRAIDRLRGRSAGGACDVDRGCLFDRPALGLVEGGGAAVPISRRGDLTPATPDALHGRPLVTLEADGVILHGPGQRLKLADTPHGDRAPSRALIDALIRRRERLAQDGHRPGVPAPADITDPSTGHNAVHPEVGRHDGALVIAAPAGAKLPRVQLLLQAAYRARFDAVAFIVSTRRGRALLWHRLTCAGGSIPACRPGQDPGRCEGLVVSLGASNETLELASWVERCRPSAPQPTPRQERRRQAERRARLAAFVRQVTERGSPAARAPAPAPTSEGIAGFLRRRSGKLPLCRQVIFLRLDPGVAPTWQRLVGLMDQAAAAGIPRFHL